MDILGIEYIDGTIEYDRVGSKYLGFRIPSSESPKVFEKLKENGIDTTRSQNHLAHSLPGVRDFIPGYDPTPPYITWHMERTRNGSTGSIDSMRFDAVKECAKILPDHVEAGKLTIAQIASVLGFDKQNAR